MITDPLKTSSPLPTYAAYVGLDWGDAQHALSLRVSDLAPVERSTLEQTPEAIAKWADALRTRFPGGRIAVCLEQSRGALLAGLMHYEHLVAYPVNPKTLARFREALYPSRSKDDPIDADLLAELLLKHRSHLRPWQPDTVQTRSLALLTEQRRKFVDGRTALTNQLLAHLKAVFPQAVSWVGEDLASEMATDFLKKWPTLQEVQKLKPSTLRKFYYGHNSRSEELISQRLEQVKTGVPLTKDPALLGAHTLAIRTLATQLAALRPYLEEHDREIAKLFAAHPDMAIFESLPGAGAALAPRLLASLGTDRTRFTAAVEASCFFGTAPVLERSGKTQNWIHMRWSCPQFLRQSWHEFANASRRFSTWASLFYEDALKKMGHHEAIRKLAYKWQRIVWRMWQTRQPYDEARHLRSLQKHGLKLYGSPCEQPEKAGE